MWADKIRKDSSKLSSVGGGQGTPKLAPAAGGERQYSFSKEDNNN
jgi:hypothetical protein